jgi:hypothetical protein
MGSLKMSSMSEFIAAHGSAVSLGTPVTFRRYLEVVDFVGLHTFILSDRYFHPRIRQRL